MSVSPITQGRRKARRKEGRRWSSGESHTRSRQRKTLKRELLSALEEDQRGGININTERCVTEMKKRDRDPRKE